MGQNPSKHSDYMQVLNTLLKSFGVEISHSSFKKLFPAIEQYCYWLNLDIGAFRNEEWQEVMSFLHRAYQSREKILCLYGQ